MTSEKTNENKKLFDWLYEQKQSIESELGEPLDWERLDERRASGIAIYRDGSIDEVEKLDDIRAWAIQELLKFRNVFFPLLKTFIKR